MTPLQIVSPTLDDADALLAFELANRAYFERSVLARADAFYNIEAVRSAIGDAVRDRQLDLSHQFLIKVDSVIVGRVNLTGLARPYFNKAMLGYRIGEQFGGHGYASRAVELALAQAFGALRLWRIEANARPENQASVRVLERNGFQVYGRSRKSMVLHGVWYDLLHFERHNEVMPSLT